MNALTAILALAGTAGVGYLVYKKVSESKENSEAYTEIKESTSKGGKLHKASMYTIGTIKTTADKISEGIKQVKNEDMVKKGELTYEQMKNTTNGIKSQVKEATDNIRAELKDSTGNIKDELKEIKNLVSSINTNPSDTASEEEADAEDKPEGIPEAEQADDEAELFEEIEIVDDQL
ncbi:MAG: hypothetical protein NC203_10990 [Firmicutes bacterium]|nr:hypothetical protein [[Eubacterium] siraeum]MCM1488879.1 hypothetical protein [Bacillota bacterium]